MIRRLAIASLALAASALLWAGDGLPSPSTCMEIVNAQKGVFSLPPMPYAFGSLEPAIDTRTMEIHYTRHHKAYVDNLNKAVTGTEWQEKTLEELFAVAHALPIAVRNNAGGHWNHSFFWNIMATYKSNNEIPDDVRQKLIENFGSVDAFKRMFMQAGLGCFGSGWAWLIATPDDTLLIISTPNQDNPLMDNAPVKGTPLLCVDVWEHAYYLKYLNRRDEYLNNFWNVVNWDRVYELLNGKPMSKKPRASS